MLTDKTLKDFNEVLASSEPAPGGGSTAALCGVLASSLTMMVFNLSFGKKSYEALAEEIKNDMSKEFLAIKELNSELMLLVDEDTKAFNLYMQAVKMPKETLQEKEIRDKHMKEACVFAIKVPLMVARKCLEILNKQQNIATYGNKNAVSDIGVGALLALTGLEGAALNVKINLPGLDDAEKEEFAVEIEKYLYEGKKLQCDIMKIVGKRIDN